MRTATITIDSDALTHNLIQVKKLAPNAKVLAMVKADAYGHGIAKALLALQQADGIGVASFTEAFEARQLGWSKAIGLIEGVFNANEWQQAIEQNCSCVIHHAPQLSWALDIIPAANSLTRVVWLKYNTGMNRLGFDNFNTVQAAQKLHDAGYEIILTTHFANADNRGHPLNSTQIQRFDNMLNLLKNTITPDIQASVCNSAAIINFENHHYDWVRPGIMLYGSSPVNDKSATELDLQPVMELSAQIMAFQTLKIGEAIGYGSRWIAQKTTRTALVSIGYGDGYPRVISDDAYVTVKVINQDNDGAKIENSYRCAIRGRVSMDMIVIDLSDVPESVNLNSNVILWGNTPHVDEVAAFADTIGYELLCRLSARPQRL